MDVDEKACPYCAETIKSAAIICRYCNRNLVESVPLSSDARTSDLQSLPPSETTYVPSPHKSFVMTPPAKGQAQPGFSCGRVMGLFLLVLGAVVIWGIIQSPQHTTDTSADTSAATDSASTTYTPPAPVTAPSTAPVSTTPPLIKRSESFTRENEYCTVTGEVTNATGDKIDNLEAVSTFYDAKGSVVTSSDALVNFNPLMPGQTSTYTTYQSDNPLIVTERTEFQVLGGEQMEFKDASISTPTHRHRHRR